VDVVAKYNLFEKFIFYPAQFWEHKNHENLIRALLILKNRGCVINAVFVGAPKNNYKKVVQLVDQLSLNSQIRMLGYVSDNEMRSLYQKSIMLVYPTQIGPSNIPPLEAIYLGVPMAVSGIYEMPDQLGAAALYFNPNDPQDIAEKINILWNDKDLRKRLISNCKRKVEEFGMDIFLNNLNKIIGKINESQ
jgi:glycosyltransferase involved in cell wall biosynthesis